MNGAAMDYRQEQDLHQHKDSSSLHSSAYQMNPACHQPNTHPHYSKAMNYQSDPYLVHGFSESLQNRDIDYTDYRNKQSSSSDNWDGRHVKQEREPIDLPVPLFEIDENYVGVHSNSKVSKIAEAQDSKDLDLDTRIDLLIKSKALSGMHPIFYHLNESEDSSLGSDDSLPGLSGSKSKNKLEEPDHGEVSTPVEVICHTSFDNPETPLSRPPSPFLSRATYLFWFNKAIEHKQQAKAQEKELLEIATKKLAQSSSSAVKTKETCEKRNDTLFKNLLDEVSKEITHVIKQEFIREIIENAAFDSLEHWWENQKNSNECSLIEESPVVSSTTDENGKEIVKTKHVISLESGTLSQEKEPRNQKSVYSKKKPHNKAVSPKTTPLSENIKNDSENKLLAIPSPSEDELPPQKNTSLTKSPGKVLSMDCSEKDISGDLKEEASFTNNRGDCAIAKQVECFDSISPGNQNNTS